MQTQSNVGDNLEAHNASWHFGGNTCETFSQHVRRSVPLYDEGHKLICSLSDFFVKADSVCYELGSSVGELTRRLSEHNRGKPDVLWYGLDAEESMTRKARDLGGPPNVCFETADITSYPYVNADYIVAYYTVQFVPPRLRQQLIDRLFQTLNWGGGLVMFEKVRGADARFQDILTALYTDFKLDNGYTPGEIVAKSRSLKGVLEPFSTQGNLDLLARAGFQDVMTVMKCACFEGFLAIK